MSLKDERLRLAALLVVLALLAAYLFTTRIGPFAGGGESEASVGCVPPGDTEVATVSREELGGLREDLRRVVAFEPGLIPYEQGPITPIAAWSDAEPGTQRALPPGRSQPGGYEMRWWMPDGDDVVADVMVFAGAGEARDYRDRASDARECRTAAVSRPAEYPAGGRNLEWRNPFGLAQQDVFVARGRRVYRISVVGVGADGDSTPAGRSAGFVLVNGLACALPGAACWGQVPPPPQKA